ncbi:MAG: tRNA sulfurtransferase [Candidatus Nanohaloarchaea archaeon]
MEKLLVRYGEIGSKTRKVQQQMRQVLRQRVADRLEYEDLSYGRVSSTEGRILVEDVDAEKAADAVAELPGVASVSPAYSCENSLQQIREEAARLEIGSSFGVDTHRATETSFDSRDVNHEVGSFLEDKTGAEVDLESPETWVYVEIRSRGAYVFTEKIPGPDGFPVGTNGELAALVSGGIDSPVAAYEVMKRGADITPVYFYNQPLAAEDHLMRFRAAIKKLERFNPAPRWRYYIVDMEEVNRELMDEVERGRMLMHREIMFRVAEELVEKDGLDGIVTGESMGQKSSQTARNLRNTSSIEKPIHRPLLTLSKNEIIRKARKLGTYELAEVDSACRSIAPDHPATSMTQEKVEELREKVSIRQKAFKALENTEKRDL